jgi:GNAT superfamily N-acetyltransferase
MGDSTVTIRPIEADDDLDELFESDDDWPGAQLVRGMIASAGEGLLVFHVAVQNDRLVGYAEGLLAIAENPSRTGRGSVWVRPDSRGRGVGSALWAVLQTRAAEGGAGRLITRVDASDEASLRWLGKIGATTGGTHLESQLALGDDLPVLPPPAGVTVQTLTTDSSEAEWHAAHEAHERLMRDTPDAETNPSPTPYAVYRTLLAHPWQLCLATTDEGAIVGLTCVFPRNEKDRVLNTMLTAVNREWRGKGLATALKTTHAVQLRDASWRAIVTQNMEGNDHILAANKRLGFEPSKATVDAIYDFPAGAV